MTVNLSHLRHLGPHPAVQVVPTRAQMGIEDSDLVSTPVDFVAGAHTMQYHGGLTIHQPRLVVVRVGPQWFNDWAKFVQFCEELMLNGYLSKLDYAGCTSGQFIGSYEGPRVDASFSDLAAQAYMAQILKDGLVPAADGSTIYSLMLPSGVTSQLDGSSSCSAFCGYHSSVQIGGKLVLYTVQPATDCSACNQGDPFAGATMVESHEVAESISDPTGQGWYEDATGMENADIVAWIELMYGKWPVQGYADPAGNNVMGAYVANPQPEPQPGPQPQPQPKTCHDVAVAVADAELAKLDAAYKANPRGWQARFEASGGKKIRDAIERGIAQG